MKKVLLIVASCLMLISLQASAQGKAVQFGVVGGLNFNTSKILDVDVKASTGWNAGVTAKAELPLGFSVQPSLIYSQKNANLTDNVKQAVGYLQLPVSVQWGPDLILFRPFIDVTPFVGYGLTNSLKTGIGGFNAEVQNQWDGIKSRLEYGLGLGAGVNVWKMQFILRYNWNFGSLYGVEGWDDIKDQVGQLITDLTGKNIENKNFGGITLNVGIFF